MKQVMNMELKFELTNGELKIPCKLTESDYGVRRIVLGVHGLAGGTNDAIQCALAEEMELFDGATFRFDFPAHGDSPHDSTYFNLKNCITVLLTVAREARARYPEVEDLCIFATGFGAYVTLIALPQILEMPGTVKLVVQTPSVLMHETLLAIKNTSEAALRSAGKFTFNFKRPLDITYEFYKELEANIVLNPHPIPMLILHTDGDKYIPMDHVQQLRRVNEKSKLVIIPGVGHQFLEEGAWDQVLDLTRDWFECEQVLLCDWS